MSFLGIVIMALTQPPSSELTQSETKSQFLIGLGFALFTVSGIASLNLSGRQLRSIHVSVIQLHYAFWGVVLSFILLLFEPRPTGRGLFELDTSTYLIMFLSGAVNTCGMYGWVYAAHNARPTTVSSLTGVTGVLYYFISDIYVFDQAFSKGQIVGAAVMVVANLAYVLDKIQKEKAKEQQESVEQEELVALKTN